MTAPSQGATILAARPKLAARRAGWERRRARKEDQAERQAEREREVWEAIQPAIRAIEDEHDIIFAGIACFDRIGGDGKFGRPLLVLLKAEDD